MRLSMSLQVPLLLVALSGTVLAAPSKAPAPATGCPAALSSARASLCRPFAFAIEQDALVIRGAEDNRTAAVSGAQLGSLLNHLDSSGLERVVVRDLHLDGLAMLGRSRVGVPVAFEGVTFDLKPADAADLLPRRPLPGGDAIALDDGTVDIPLSFVGVEFRAPLRLQASRFTKPLHFEGARFWAGLSIADSQIAGGLTIERSYVRGCLDLDHTQVQGDLTIADNFVLQSPEGCGTEPASSYAVNLDAIAVEGSLRVAGNVVQAPTGDDELRAVAMTHVSAGQLVEVQRNLLPGRLFVSDVRSRGVELAGNRVTGLAVVEQVAAPSLRSAGNSMGRWLEIRDNRIDGRLAVEADTLAPSVEAVLLTRNHVAGTLLFAPATLFRAHAVERRSSLIDLTANEVLGQMVVELPATPAVGRQRARPGANMVDLGGSRVDGQLWIG